jgi:16S rRNA (guanine966-N2)-methyltransferase|tara:strand:+ start:7544 stop:8104 length:561 start_codon:yes stop_codon:yes gene_type:complete
MRVISGTLKGRLINFIKNSNTRPLKDSVKESIFNILDHSNLLKTELKNSNILDLYSGIGSFGIECISRSAKKVTFVERNINSAKMLKENLVKLSILDKSKVYNGTAETFLSKKTNEKFNIFFLDPPFADNQFLNNLELIRSYSIYSKNHVVIIHREIKSNDKLSGILEIAQTKNYGRSKILFGFFK